MNLFGLVGSAIADHVGENAQVKAAQIAYRVARKCNGGWPEWIDMTQREQARWIAAVGDVYEER